ncbi:MAG: DUF5694 domain-containing protein [Gemmatimonadota bacterium]|nr:DUF5694 domain-containing protein [Gemmatimonadota bacterium]
MLRSITLIAVSSGLLVASTGAFAQEACGPVPLRASIADDERTEILVLATPHLRRLEALDPGTLGGLLDALERWAPDAIGIEGLPSEDVVAMKRLPGFEPVLERFASRAIRAARVASPTADPDPGRAARAIDSLTTTLITATEAERAAIRARLVPLLAESHRLHTAALQWSYLKDESPDLADQIPDSLRVLLDDVVASASEESSIGLALARRLGHSRIHPVDDHFDKDAYLEMAGALQAEMKETEAYRELVSSGALEASTARLREAHEEGDLLPHYLEINAPEAQAEDVDLQWDFFFRTGLASGLDRARVAMWEERNYGIAANVRRMTAQIPGGRALVVIGASHKPFLDAYLACGMDVTVVQLEEVVGDRATLSWRRETLSNSEHGGPLP